MLEFFFDIGDAGDSGNYSLKLKAAMFLSCCYCFSAASMLSNFALSGGKSMLY